MMMYQLTSNQRDLLVEKTFGPYSYFNPVYDVNGFWFISPQEVEQCINEEFLWVKDLPLNEFIQPSPPQNRQQKVDFITSYMRSELTDNEFRHFISDVRDHFIDYLYQSETLYYWFESSNSPDWGDFTQDGFKTNPIYRGQMVDGVYPRAEYVIFFLNSRF
jgi:hypothetical protein